MAKLVSTNPGKNYEPIGELEVSTDAAIKAAVAAAHKAKLAWKELGIKKRAELMKIVYDRIEKKKDEFALMITREMGKTLPNSKEEVECSLEEIKWYIENVENALKDVITYQDDEQTSRIVYEPHGVAAVITPWNFPLEMLVWGVLPNLLVGNTVVFKTSEECALVGKLIDEVMEGVLPEGVFNQLYGSGDVGHKIVMEDVNLIWFTGSSKVGKELYKIAADKFIKVVLELGGSSPGVVFEDVDVDKAVEKIYAKRFRNCGQSCNALKRLIVQESIYDKVIDKLKKFIEAKKMADPESEGADLGPVVAKRQVDLLKEQVKDAIGKGAKVIIGGKQPEGLKGAYYEPTILTNITKDMRVWKEEVFGPVLAVVPFKDEDEAVKLANDTVYGLGAYLFSNDKKKIRRVASRVDAGSVEINEGSRWCTMDNPFGGYKLSGIGREHGSIGFRELCQIKVISE